jgi:hypothetical protein
VLQGDLAVVGQARHDIGQQLGRQGNRPTGFDLGRKTGLDAQGLVKARQAHPLRACIGGQQNIGEDRQSGARGHRAADEGQVGTEVTLGAEQFHGRRGALSQGGTGAIDAAQNQTDRCADLC